MILGEVEETVTVIEIDEETYEEVRHTSTISPFHHFTIAPFHHCTIAPGAPLHYCTRCTIAPLHQVYRSTKRSIPMLFVRGDGVILVSPPMRTTG